jgi:methylase of polypeptide subunit release factors
MLTRLTPPSICGYKPATLWSSGALEGPVSDATGPASKPLGAEYLETLTLQHRRLNGQTYTPDYLVDFILEHAGYTPDRPIERVTILDPACGAGAFLGRAVLAIASRLRHLGHDISAPQGRRVLLDIVAANLHGVDLDPQACALARTAVQRVLRTLTPGNLPEDYFAANVVHADFLTDPLVDALSPARTGGFDYIVGNPPYVSATRISASYKRALRRRFATAGGRLDLYTVFIERSLALLGKGGRLALITPDKFLISQTAKALRRFIVAQSAVRTIAQFQSHKVFHDAATVPCVMILERGAACKDVNVLQCADQPRENGRVTILSRSKFPHDHLRDAAWQLKPRDLLLLAQRVRGSYRTLADRTVRVSAGPATGRDGLYVLSADSEVEIEPELLRPAVRGRDLGAYRIENPKLNILLPYVFSRRGEPCLISLSAFPKARRYLERHRTELEQRHCIRVWGKRWYDLHDQVRTDLAKQVKILVPDVANSNRFAVDRGQFFPLHSAYYLIPNSDIDPDFLAAVLNSRVSEFLIRLLAPVVKDGFSRYRRQFLATLPIPEGTAVKRERLAEASRAGDATTANRLVAQLFGLSDVDENRIEEFIADRDRLHVPLV